MTADNFYVSDSLRAVYDVFLLMYDYSESIIGLFMSPVPELFGDVLLLPNVFVESLSIVFGWFGLADTPLFLILIGGGFGALLIATLVKWVLDFIPLF